MSIAGRTVQYQAWQKQSPFGEFMKTEVDSRRVYLVKKTAASQWYVTKLEAGCFGRRLLAHTRNANLACASSSSVCCA